MAMDDGSGFAFPNDNFTGMTLRQWYAGMALIGLVNAGPKRSNFTYQEAAFDIADAMIEEGKRREKQK